MAFESLPGIKIKDHAAKRTYILADFFSVYEGIDTDEGGLPDIYHWSSFGSIAETKDAFIFKHTTGDKRVDKEFVITTELIPDPRVWIRVRAIVEGAVAANPDIDYTYGKRVLPPKTLCAGCDISAESFVATGIYEEGEINNANVVFLNSSLDKLIWAVAPGASIIAFVIVAWQLGDLWNPENVLSYAVIGLMCGLVAGISAYLFSAYRAKMLYRRLLKADPALCEEITFVVCEEGFIAAESALFDFTDIIHWYKAAYFMETNHMYIVFTEDKRAVFWLPKRLFPKEVHQEIGDFIADRLLQKPVKLKVNRAPAPPQTEKAAKPEKVKKVKAKA